MKLYTVDVRGCLKKDFEAGSTYGRTQILFIHADTMAGAMEKAEAHMKEVCVGNPEIKEIGYRGGEVAPGVFVL